MERTQQYERVFKHFDSDKDGKLSASELQKCVASLGEELSLEEAAVAIQLLDSDGDGLLELEEFVSFFEGGHEEEKIRDLREAFKMYEMEGCGFITPKSLKRMLSQLGQSKSIRECEAMIAEFDLNGDGVLNFDEFKVMVEKIGVLPAILVPIFGIVSACVVIAIFFPIETPVKNWLAQSWKSSVAFLNSPMEYASMMIEMEKTQQYKRVFMHFDSNKDGKLSASELRKCVASLGEELSLEEAAVAIQLLDSDGDGLLELEEFVSFFEGGDEEEKIRDLREAFKMYEMEGVVLSLLKA
ncbi:EF-hand domain [Dillenia turbinata]|uniref:EF-hand domain n=1 Tax=Dillenia turbinata TaxID=194707 RepID=A0AAN8UHV0_9MAGN